jgi:hypothetical protein
MLNVIGIVKRCCAALERRIIEVPLLRSELPNKLRKIVLVFVIACLALGGNGMLPDSCLPIR